MNGKKARKLRQKARVLTIGQPDELYYRTATGAIVLHPLCTKGMYRQLKKEYLERKRQKK